MSKLSCEKWKLKPFSVSDEKFSLMKKKCKSDKFDKYDCEFFSQTSMNPQTMRKITSESTKKKISNKCTSNTRKQLTLEEICKKWKKEPFVNPRTNRKLSSEKSKVYLALEQECKTHKQSPRNEKKSQKREERRKRDLEPFDEVKREIEKLTNKLKKCKTEDELDNWELEYDDLKLKKDRLLANTHELVAYKKELRDMFVDLFMEYEDRQYECEKNKNKKNKKTRKNK